MPFADDQLYRGYVRRNMSKMVSTVKVREILPHLPCLTEHDRETIGSKRDMLSNYDAVVHLLDCLKRRDNWPDQLIQALEACEHRAIAAEMRSEYNQLKYPTSGAFVSKSPNHFPATETQFQTQSAFAASDLSVPTASSRSPETPTHSAIPQVAVTTTQVPQLVAPSPPPPQTPETQQHPVSTPPPAAAAENTRIHQEPEENSFIQTSCGIPDDSVISGPSPQAAHLSQSEDAAPKKVLVTPPRNPTPSRSPLPTNPNVPQEVSFHIKTPEKPPVQDTTPPAEAATTTAPRSDLPSQPATTKLLGKPSPTSAPLHRPADGNADTSVCLSKPTQLCSIPAPNHVRPSPGSAEDSTFSNLVSLQISDAVQPAPTPAPEGAPCWSLQDEPVIVGRVSEEPSRPNMAGQSVSRSVNSLAMEGETGTRIPSKPQQGATPGKYFLLAAGVAACALLVAWRFRRSGS